MSYKLEPAFAVAPGLARKLVLAGMDLDNQWFFSDGAFTENGIIEHQPNTWNNENFVVLDDEGIIAFFCATWNRPLDIISGFRLILFEKNTFIESLFFLASSRFSSMNFWRSFIIPKIGAYKILFIKNTNTIKASRSRSYSELKAQSSSAVAVGLKLKE